MSKSLSKKILKTFYLLPQKTKAFIDREDITFILYDAGESKALIPVFDILEECGLNFHILAFATSSRLVKDYQKRVIDLSKKLGKKPYSSQWLREEKLSEKQLEIIFNSLNTNYVVTGMVSSLQQQISKNLKKKGIFVVGYYDSFSPITTGSISYSFLHCLDEVLLPSEDIAENIQNLFPQLRVLVVGQPSIETWQKMIKEGFNENKKFNFNRDGRFTIIYVGGYGHNYSEAFQLFLDSVENELECRIIISLHPKVNGDIEKELLSKKSYPHIEILSKEIPTNCAVLYADLVVTQCSTVGVQAIFIEKPVIFLDVKDSTFNNVAIKNGWAQKISSKEEFLKVLSLGVEDPSKPTKCIFKQGGIPKKASTLIFNAIQAKSRNRIFQVLQRNKELGRTFSQTLSTMRQKNK